MIEGAMLPEMQISGARIASLRAASVLQNEVDLAQA
jgi:hypothetical protein